MHHSWSSEDSAEALIDNMGLAHLPAPGTQSLPLISGPGALFRIWLPAPGPVAGTARIFPPAAQFRRTSGFPSDHDDKPRGWWRKGLHSMALPSPADP